MKVTYLHIAQIAPEEEMLGRIEHEKWNVFTLTYTYSLLLTISVFQSSGHCLT